MTYGRMPLFPPACAPGSTLRVPLFGGCDSCCGREECQTVRICNPACPDEFADVELCVDSDGNLSICVHRPPKCCAPHPKRHRPCFGASPWR